ncbi:MAG TPA: amidohydrolase family protein [Gemmatimonadales bacterium]|nr:amidohydrolase family protein [Gemmatimonadales bacterium]
MSVSAETRPPEAPAAAPAAPALPPVPPRPRPLGVSKHDLASFAKSSGNAPCYNRDTEPYTAVVDTHFHPRPFGGPAIPMPDLLKYFDKLGVRFVVYMGIGQVLELGSGCTYYLSCIGTAAKPGVKNDFVNGMDLNAYAPKKVLIIPSMTFMDLAHPEDIVDRIKLYDREYPGMFRWAGEVNVMKQALIGNLHEPASLANIDAWAPFMQVLRERNIPITLHSDLGNNANPTQYLFLMEHVLKTYPDNKIVWAHMGLSKELTTMNANQHVATMKSLLDKYPNLMLDISWDVLYNAYRAWGEVFVKFFNENPTRILPGSDFVAAGTKDYSKYENELEITSRVLRLLNDDAFRAIALGENFFKFTGIDYVAPQVCRHSNSPNAPVYGAPRR